MGAYSSRSLNRERTDSINHWLRNSCDEHMEICERLRNKDINLYQESRISAKEWNKKCEFCGNSPLHVAIIYGDFGIIDLILRSGVPVNLPNDQGETALHLAISENKSHVLIGHLLRYGANPNHRDNSGTTPLHMAVVKSQLLNVECLLKYGANVNLVFNLEYQRNSFHEAIMRHLPEMVCLLSRFDAHV